MGYSHWKASGLPLTPDRLKEFVSYDPETGHFTWIVNRPGRKATHAIGAGERPRESGGRMISIDGARYSTARLAWFYHFREWPLGAVGHKNRDGEDDRISNLEDSGKAKCDFAQENIITAERLRALTTYNPDTGLFLWRTRSGRSGGRSRAGHPTCAVKDIGGYVRTRIDRRNYRQHRLVWLYMTGEWPPAGLVVDHINCDPSDNRWANLRLATRAENSRNGLGRKQKKAPYKGIVKGKNGLWTARLTLNLGTFNTAEEAHAAYVAAARHHFGEFANPGRGSPDST